MKLFRFRKPEVVNIAKLVIMSALWLSMPGRQSMGLLLGKNKFEAQIAEIKINNEQVILVKPQTYMNLSGVAVAPIVKWYKAQLEDVIII